MKNLFLLFCFCIILQGCAHEDIDRTRCKYTIVTVTKVLTGKSSGIEGKYVVNGIEYPVSDRFSNYHMVVGEKIKVCYYPEDPGTVFFQDAEPVFCKGEESVSHSAKIKTVNRTFSFVSKGERAVIYSYKINGLEVERSQRISLALYQKYAPRSGDSIPILVSKRDNERAVLMFPNRDVFFECKDN